MKSTRAVLASTQAVSPVSNWTCLSLEDDRRWSSWLTVRTGLRTWCFARVSQPFPTSKRLSTSDRAAPGSADMSGLGDPGVAGGGVSGSTPPPADPRHGCALRRRHDTRDRAALHLSGA